MVFGLVWHRHAHFPELFNLPTIYEGNSSVSHVYLNVLFLGGILDVFVLSPRVLVTVLNPISWVNSPLSNLHSTTFYQALQESDCYTFISSYPFISALGSTSFPPYQIHYVIGWLHCD